MGASPFSFDFSDPNSLKPKEHPQISKHLHVQQLGRAWTNLSFKPTLGDTGVCTPKRTWDCSPKQHMAISRGDTSQNGYIMWKMMLEQWIQIRQIWDKPIFTYRICRRRGVAANSSNRFWTSLARLINFDHEKPENFLLNPDESGPFKR